MESKFKRAFTRTTAVLFAALLLATSAYVPQVAQVVPTGIVASAADYMSVSNETEFGDALKRGGNYTLDQDITWMQNQSLSVVSNKTVQLNLGGHKLDLGNCPLECFGKLIIEGEGEITGGADHGLISLRGADSVVNLVSDDITYKYTNDDSNSALLEVLLSNKIKVSGGTFVSASNMFKKASNGSTINITGGKFNRNFSSSYLANGYGLDQDGDWYTVVKYNYSGDYWGMTEDGTLYLFDRLPSGTDKQSYGWNAYRSDIKKVVALDDAKAGTSLKEAFKGCTQLEEADLKKLNVSETKSFESVFNGCGSLSEVDVSDWNTRGVEKMNSMFRDCPRLKSLDLSDWNTSSVTNMYGVFLRCTGLTSLNISNWDTSSVTNMDSMFYGCSSLESLDLSEWITSSVEDMTDVFYGCSSLESLDLSKWKTSGVSNMARLFKECTGLTSLNISSWDTRSVTNMNSMFYGCSSLESLDLSSWDTSSSAEQMIQMFFSCDMLSSLTVGENVSILAGARLPNKYNLNTGLVEGWYDEDGELISGEDESAVISKQSGVLRRGTKDFTDVTVEDIEDQIYPGQDVTPVLTVKDDRTETELTEGIDYKVTFANNTEVGTATANVIGIGDYVGKVTKNFKIIRSDITGATIGELKDVIYTGNEFTPDVTVTLNGNTLTNDTDYTVEYTDNIDAGTATVTVTGKGNYKGTVKKTFKILNLLDTTGLDNAIGVKVYDTNKSEVTASEGKYVVEPGYTITSNAALEFDGVIATGYKPGGKGNLYPDNYTYKVTELTENIGEASHKHDMEIRSDYRLQIKCNTEVGNVFATLAELTVNGDGVYEYGEKIEIKQDNEGPGGAYAEAAKKYGNGKLIRFVSEPAYHDRGTENNNWDGNVRTDIGSYTVSSGAEYGASTYYLYKDYEIKAKDVEGLTAMIDLDGKGTAYGEVEFAQLPNITYDGKTYTPTASLVYNNFWDGTEILTDKVLEPGVDYTVDIEEGEAAGKYKITFKGMGNFNGIKTVEWNITKANMTLVDDNQGAYQFVYNGKNTVDAAAFNVSGAPEGAQATYTYFSKSGLELPSAPTTVGSYKVKITYKKENYNDAEIELDFYVTKRPVTLTPVEGQKITYGKAIPTKILYTVEAADGDRGLIAGDEITGNLIAVNGTGILNAGTYDYVLVDSACDFANYTVTLNSDSKFTVEKKVLTKDMFTVKPTSFNYTGLEQTVAVNGSDSIGVRLDPEDFEMSVANPDSQYINLLKENDWSIVDNTNRATNAGTYVVKVKASDNGNYQGVIELNNDNQKWTIKSKSMSSDDISVVASDQTYTGSDITETVTVTDGTTPLMEGTDYEIITAKSGDEYTDAQSLTQKHAGTYTFYIKGMGNYADDKKGTWQITSADIYSVKVAGGSKTYDGKPVTEKDFRVTTKLTETSAKDPNADIKYNFVFRKNGAVVTDPTDAGTYTVEVTAYDAKGNYQSETVGTDGKITFTIAKRKVELYPNEGQSAEYGTVVAGLTIDYTTEKADEESITGLLPTDTVDFSSALTVEFGEETPIPVGFYPIKINEAIDFGNYQAVKGEDVEFEITKATLKDERFAVYLINGNSYDNQTFNGENIKVKVVDVEGSLKQNEDFTATGDFEAYLPGTYTITVKGKGNYQGKVIKTWIVDTNKTVTASTTVATEESSDVHVYDGEAPAVNVVPNDAENPLPEFTDVTYDYYVKDTSTGGWTKLTAAPTDAGSYKVQGNAASKGYEIEVSAKEYTIAKKPIRITIDPKDLTGTYGQETFTIPYTVAEDAIIEKDKANDVVVSGEIVVDAAGKNKGELDIDFSGVTVNSPNYELVFPEDTKFTLAPKQLKDENIVFDSASADLHDIGTTKITYKVVVDGKELEKGKDYDVSGTTEADEAGAYKVQIVGKGNYAGFAEAAWTLAYNEEARNAALEVIAENVTASFKSDDSGIAATAAFTGGKRRVTATAVAALKNGLGEGDKYTVTRTGMVYYNGDMEGFDAASLTVDNADGVTMFDAGRNNLIEYKYGMIDVNKGIVAKAYAVVNDGSYETVVYSDAVKLNYDELIRYNVKVNGGTILATGEKEAQYSGTDIQQNKPFVRVTVDAKEIPEGQQFLYWTKNGVVASYAETFSFYMSEKDTVVTALYADEDEEIERLAASYMDSITLLPDEDAFRCVTMSSVPDDCTILKSGLIFTDKEITDPDEFTSAEYLSNVRGDAPPSHNCRYRWRKTKVGDGTYYVRSYVKYTDANGVEKETYGDVYKISMAGYEVL